MELEKIERIKKERQGIRPLLSTTDPADALASYYALWHDPRRTQLSLHHNPSRRVDGFVVVCQTGIDLFRPLVTLRAADEIGAIELLRAALAPGRPYQVIVPVTLAAAVQAHLVISRSSLLHIYRLDPLRFAPIINVLVQRVAGAAGTPRFQIESQNQVMAMSGTNWRSPAFAEVFVYVHPQGRGRGWGKSVVSACTAALLEERLRPLYMVEKENEASIQIAESLGYVDTGHLVFVAEGQPHQNADPGPVP